ncbi:MAG: DUF2807 domain-containing protein [Actinobacteria bacterium]|nr:DUF2807 domain-containing protein [Actinomycetota bacterium]
MTVRVGKYRKLVLLAGIITIAVLLSFSLSSCITIRVNTLKGSGEVITKSFEVGDFDKLIFSGIGKIIIEQGEETSLEVEAESNVIDALKINTIASSLEIGFKSRFINVIPTKDIVFHLKVKDLKKIDLTGAGSIECDNLNVESLSVDSSGVGSIKINITASDLEIGISGAGKVNLSGEVDTQQLNISGVGSYDAKELVSKDCEISISGAGKAVVNATQTLDIEMSGVGKVDYVGNPSINQNVSGAGSIKSID